MNLPFNKLWDDKKCMKSKEEREAVFKELNIDLTKDINCSCQGGVTACIVYASLKDISSGNLAVYDGSWAEFSKAPR